MERKRRVGMERREDIGARKRQRGACLIIVNYDKTEKSEVSRAKTVTFLRRGVCQRKFPSAHDDGGDATKVPYLLLSRVNL